MATYKVKVQDTFAKTDWSLVVEAPDAFMAKKEALYMLRKELYLDEPKKLLFIFRLPHISMLTNYLKGLDIKIKSCRKVGD